MVTLRTDHMKTTLLTVQMRTGTHAQEIESTDVRGAEHS